MKAWQFWWPKIGMFSWPPTRGDLNEFGVWRFCQFAGCWVDFLLNVLFMAVKKHTFYNGQLMENFRKEHQGETCDSFQRRRLREDGKKRPWKLTWLAGKSTMNESMYFLMEMGKISTLMWVSGVYTGVSLNGGTPQNTPKWSFLVGKPMVVGYHHFRNPPYTSFFTFFFQNSSRSPLWEEDVGTVGMKPSGYFFEWPTHSPAVGESSWWLL